LVRTDKTSGIVNDPNAWSRDVGDPRYILDLLARIVTVSLETMRIVDALPVLDAVRCGATRFVWSTLSVLPSKPTAGG
jgi:hypothetical protein